jgi:hypothetical protein
MPDVWEYREPAERDRHPQTEVTATRWQGEQYRQDEHLSRLAGPQVDGPRHQPLPGYEQTGQLRAPSPQYTPPRQASWVSAHKGVTAVLSVCALTVAGAAAFALLPSSPGSPGPSAAAAAGVTASSRAQDQRAGSTGTAQPAAGIAVTASGATASAAPKATPSPGPTAPSAKAGPSAHPTATGSGPAPVVTGSSPVGDDRTTATVSPPPSPPPPTLPPDMVPTTCTVTGGIPEVEASVTQAEAGPNALNINIYEYGTGELAGKATLRIPGPVTAGETVSVTGSPNTLMTSCAVAGIVVTS